MKEVIEKFNQHLFFESNTYNMTYGNIHKWEKFDCKKRERTLSSHLFYIMINMVCEFVSCYARTVKQLLRFWTIYYVITGIIYNQIKKVIDWQSPLWRFGNNKSLFCGAFYIFFIMPLFCITSLIIISYMSLSPSSIPTLMITSQTLPWLRI